MKAYIMERECFDGADIADILRCCAAELDWWHLVRRFGSDWRVLLSHLILFGYIYPGERKRIPLPVTEELIALLRNEAKTPRIGAVMSRNTAFPTAIFSGRTGLAIPRCTFGRTCSDE